MLKAVVSPGPRLLSLGAWLVLGAVWGWWGLALVHVLPRVNGVLLILALATVVAASLVVLERRTRGRAPQLLSWSIVVSVLLIGGIFAVQHAKGTTHQGCAVALAMRGGGPNDTRTRATQVWPSWTGNVICRVEDPTVQEGVSTFEVPFWELWATDSS